MRLIRSSALVLATVLAAASASAQSSPVSIQFQNGMVTVRTTARVPLRTVLKEWERVGKAKIVNADDVSVTLEQIELVNVPEQEALALLLRDLSGYALGARDATVPGPSRFDRIMLLAKTATPPTGPRATSVISSTPPPPPIAFVPGDQDDDPNDVNAVLRRLPPGQNGATNAAVAAAREAAAAAAAAQNSDRNPSENAQRPGPPTNTPANPFFSGRSGRPGEIAPVPPQPQRNPLRPNGDPEP